MVEGPSAFHNCASTVRFNTVRVGVVPMGPDFGRLTAFLYMELQDGF